MLSLTVIPFLPSKIHLLLFRCNETAGNGGWTLSCPTLAKISVAAIRLLFCLAATASLKSLDRILLYILYASGRPGEA